jgi:iron complex transport system ATP-binding protein
MPVLAINDLTVAIAGVVVCRHLDLSVEPGSQWVILGRNGIGKTTLLRTLAGLYRAQQGSIALHEMSLGTWPRRLLAQKLGMQFQDPSSLFPGTVLETALIGRHPHLSRWRWESPEDFAAVEAALMELGLAGMEDRDLATLSGGERQRVAIAALLAQNPDLYLLDEPVNHLDVGHQVQALECLSRRVRDTRDRALITVLHDVNLAARFCDHALLLFGEGAALAGRTEEVLNVESLGHLYGHPMVALRSGSGTYYTPG